MKIEHLAIWVKDLEKMKDFYTRHFGATAGDLYINTTKKFSSYFLSFDGGSRLELMCRPGIIDHPGTGSQESIGIAHFAISSGSKEQVDHLTEVLEKSGCEVVGKPRTTGDGYYESVVLDPEGNRVEITI